MKTLNTGEAGRKVVVMRPARILATATTMAGVLLAWSVSHAQFGGTDAVLDLGPLVQNEVSLALLPSATAGQPTVLLAAYNDDPWIGAASGLGVSYSTDFGATWAATQLPFPADTVSGASTTWVFDPTATADTLGNFFVGHIGVVGGYGGINGLYVWKTNDGGVTWTTKVEVSRDAATLIGPGDLSYRFNDRCQITADRSSASPYKDDLYIVWIKDRGWAVPPGPPPPYSDIFISRSTDAGVSFSTPLQINDIPAHSLGNMPVPVVAADGTVLVSWLDYNVWAGVSGSIYLDKSSDGGATWGVDQLVATINLPPLNVTAGDGTMDALAKGAPVLAASPTNANELYMVYATDAVTLDADEADIFFIRSTDQGVSWTTPLQLNSDTTTNDQILPWIAVKPNGVIDVAWYDRRNDVPSFPLGDRLWNVYFTQSNDGGLTFSTEARLNDASFPTPAAGTTNPWLGEYLGLAVDSGYAYVAWTSSLTDSLGGDIYFDKIANAAPPAALCGASPVTGCLTGAKSSFQMTDRADDTKDKLKWKLASGDAFDQTRLGDPLTTRTYALCVYDETASTPALVAALEISPGAAWLDKSPKGLRYKDKLATEDGVVKAAFKTGTAGKTKVQLVAKGVNLPMPAPLSATQFFDQDTAVTVQMVNDETAACWTKSYATASKNDGDDFKAKAP
jgi:hypothetical protein